MPKRTNPFQQLASLIQKALAPAGARITESAMVDVRGGGEPREIDILIETDVGPYHVKIAVEAKDERRKMDRAKFDAIVGKYREEGSVKVDKTVVITHQGFFKPVIERAKQLGIDLLTLKQAMNADWFKLYPQSIQFRMMPHICKIEIQPPIDPQDLAKVIEEGCVYCSHGTAHGNLQQFTWGVAATFVRTHRPGLFADLEKKAQESSGQANARVCYTPDQEYHIQCLEKRFPLKKLIFNIHYINDRAAMRYTLCELTSPHGKKHAIPFAQATVGGKKLSFAQADTYQSPNGD